MQSVGLPAMAWIPPYVAQVPVATTAHACGASRSIHSQVVIGWPVAWSVPNDAQYPSLLFCSFGIDPSTIRMNAWREFPSAASRNGLTKSSPTSYARNGLWKLTLGIQGRAPAVTSSMLGWVAPVIAIVSPSQPSPAVNQRISISLIALARACISGRLTWASLIDPPGERH